MFKDVDFKGGEITYDDFHIDFNKPLSDQIFSLKEDLFQVSYDEKYLIDIGWYPELSTNGWLKIRVIQNYDWINPLYKKRCKTKKSLKKFLTEAINLINSKTSKN